MFTKIFKDNDFELRYSNNPNYYFQKKKKHLNLFI